MFNRPTPKKILVARTDRIGDVMLSTPVLRNLRIAFPQAHIAFLCSPYTRPIIEGNPNVDEVIVYDKATVKGVAAQIKFSSSLRAKNFDWALILHPTTRVHLLTFCSGIPFRVGWNRKNGWLLTKRLVHDKQKGLKHEAEYTLDILRALDIAIVSRETHFPLKETSEARVERLLSSFNVKKFIVVHPSASCPSKRWPTAYFSRFVKLLKERTGLPIVVITSDKERQHAQQVVDENDVYDLRGMLSISELGSLLKRAALFISNDSGPVHIASSFNTPVISIFGRNDPGLSSLRWGPLGKKSVSLHKEVGCSVCRAHTCANNFLCLKEIRPAEVLEKALELLSL
jgi:lipopolysaccharide heptosyltransferase II